MKLQGELDYLYGLTRLGIKPGLAVMEQMMIALGHPERKFKTSHVTGTNGKGSTCAMMESVLRVSGLNVALYTSPHLFAFNERIQINRVSISDADLAILVKEIRGVCERDTIQPTFFEFTTALAFLYFSRADIDIAIIEVGMGGRYDATNLITPTISVITNIGLDHTEYFGPTTAHVAREKAGVIKEGVPVVVGEQDPEMLKIFEAEADSKHTKVIRVGDVVSAELLSAGLDGQEVNVQLGEAEKLMITLPLLGAHQIENMKTAIAAITAIIPTLSMQAISTGIATTKWQGRLQVISREPLIIVDGAHNPDGARALGDFLHQLQRHDVLVLAVKKGKDISDMIEYVIPLFSHIIITEGEFMPESAELVAEKVSGIGKRIMVEVSPEKALEIAKNLAPVHGTIVVTGSLYMIPAVLAYLSTSDV